MKIKILVLGDIVGAQGCEFVRSRLPKIKSENNIDLCIANAENSAVGNGITPDSAQYLFDSGVDFITTGNHAFRRKEVYSFLDEREDVIRPANYYAANPGKGYGIIDFGRLQVGVINLIGQFTIDGGDNPFLTVDSVLEKLHSCKIIVVDFHCEATAEKRAMGLYLDGRVSVVFGSHTHVQTADEQILKNSTGYITDAGMCGPIDSVLGVKAENVIKKLKENMPAKFDVADGPCMINGCIFEIDDKTGKAVSAQRVYIKEK